MWEMEGGRDFDGLGGSSRRGRGLEGQIPSSPLFSRPDS